MEIIATFLNGLSLGGVYAMIALGYTMVYGIAKMLNFAHGDVIMVGAYICFYAVSRFDLPPLAGVILAMLVCTVLGMVVERLVGALAAGGHVEGLAVDGLSGMGNLLRGGDDVHDEATHN